MGEGVAVPLKVPNVGEAFVGPSWMDNRSYPASKLKAAKFKVEAPAEAVEPTVEEYRRRLNELLKQGQ